MIKKIIVVLILSLLTAPISAAAIPDKDPSNIYTPKTLTEQIDKELEREKLAAEGSFALSNNMLVLDKKVAGVLLDLANYSESIDKKDEQYPALLILIYSINSMRLASVATYTHSIQLYYCDNKHFNRVYKADKSLFLNLYFKLLHTNATDIEYNATFIKDKKLANKTTALIGDVVYAFNQCLNYIELLAQ